MDNVDRKEIFRVVVKDKEQYSGRTIKRFQKDRGKQAKPAKDMRPLSLRKAMEGRVAHQTNDSECCRIACLKC
jgi:hypothetical protein